MDILAEFNRTSASRPAAVVYGTAGAPGRAAAPRLPMSSSELSHSFKGAVLAAPVPRASASPQTSVLQSLAPDLRTDVHIVTPVRQEQVTHDTKGLTGGMIADRQQNLSRAQGEVKDVKAGISDTIARAKGEIIAATKAAKLDPSAIFRDKQMASAGAAGLMGQMALAQMGMAAGGQGSLATFAQHASTLDYIVGDRAGAGMSRKEAMSRIADQLRSQSAPVTPHPVASAVSLLESPKTNLDWKGFLDTHGVEGLEKVMALDPKNPNPEIVPEFAALDALDQEFDRVTFHNDDVQDDLDDLRFGLAMAAETLPVLNLSLREAQALPVDRGAEQVLARLAPKPELPVMDDRPSAVFSTAA